MEALPINSQWRFFIHHCVQHAKEGVIDKIDCGVDVYWTRCNWRALNGLFLSIAVSDEHDLRRRFEDIKTYVSKMQPTFPWMLSIESELVPLDVRERLQEICLATEFVRIVKVKCMQTTKLLPPVRPLPIVEVKFAVSQQDVYDAVLLNLQARKMDTSIAESVIEHHAFITDFNKEFCCIVSINEKPVSTAITVLLDKCLYVALVVTCPHHRKHGYAEVALRASIERALEMLPRTGYVIILHATEIGRSMYSRIGFKDVSDLDMYVYKPSTFI